MFRKLLLMTISVLPLNLLRILAYRLLPGYDIDFNSYVAPLVMLDVKICRLRSAHVGPLNWVCTHALIMRPRSRIGKLNKFQHAHDIVLEYGSAIVSHNSFVGSEDRWSPFATGKDLRLGEKSVITRNHVFDLTDSITIGSDVTIGGRQCQLWTHGFDLTHVRIQAPVRIGNHVYLGSACLVLQGVDVCDHVSIGAGTVVSKSIMEPGFYVSAGLTRKSTTRDYSNDTGVVEHRGAKFIRRTPEIRSESVFTGSVRTLAFKEQSHTADMHAGETH